MICNYFRFFVEKQDPVPSSHSQKQSLNSELILTSRQRGTHLGFVYSSDYCCHFELSCWTDCASFLIHPKWLLCHSRIVQYTLTSTHSDLCCSDGTAKLAATDGDFFLNNLSFLKLIHLPTNISFPSSPVLPFICHTFPLLYSVRFFNHAAHNYHQDVFSYSPCCSFDFMYAIWIPNAIKGFRIRFDRSMWDIWKAVKGEVAFLVTVHNSAKPGRPPTCVSMAISHCRYSESIYILFTTFQITCFLQM